MLTVLLFILGSVFTIGFVLLDSLPTLNFTIPVDIFTNIGGFFNGVAFFLPVSALLVLFQLKMLVLTFRIFWSLVMRVKSFIPTISGT